MGQGRTSRRLYTLTSTIWLLRSDVPILALTGASHRSEPGYLARRARTTTTSAEPCPEEPMGAVTFLEKGGRTSRCTAPGLPRSENHGGGVNAPGFPLRWLVCPAHNQVSRALPPCPFGQDQKLSAAKKCATMPHRPRSEAPFVVTHVYTHTGSTAEGEAGVGRT